MRTAGHSSCKRSHFLPRPVCTSSAFDRLQRLEFFCTWDITLFVCFWGEGGLLFCPSLHTRRHAKTEVTHLTGGITLEVRFRVYRF